MLRQSTKHMYFIMLYYQCFEQKINKMTHLNKLQSPIYRLKKEKLKDAITYKKLDINGNAGRRSIIKCF